MMRFGPSMLKSPLLVVIAVSAFSQSSFAAPTVLNLNYEATSSVTQNFNLPTNSPGKTSIYGNTFEAPNIPSGAVTGSTGNANYPQGFEFYDDYVFTISDSNVSSITATINLDTLSLADLNVRLFYWLGSHEDLYDTVTVGTPLTGPSIQSWQYMPFGGTGEVAIINKTGLTEGTYVLQVRGNVTGPDGGSYAGTLNVTPVPLPSALPLLLSGVGLLGVFARRRAVA